MSDLPELPKELNDVLEFLYGAEALDGVWYGEPPTDRPPYWWRSKLRAAVASFAREAMEIGRRAGLEEAARIASGQAEALAENLYGHPREKAVEWAKEDKFDSQVAVANDLLSIVADAIYSAVSKKLDSAASN